MKRSSRRYMTGYPWWFVLPLAALAVLASFLLSPLAGLALVLPFVIDALL